MIQMVITIAIIAVVLAIRLPRMMKERPLKIERLWIVPTIILAIAAVDIYFQPPHGAGWVWCVPALALGGALGWQRGRMMHISVDPANHALKQKGSIAAVMFFLAIFAVRFGLKEIAQLHIGGIDFDVNTVAAALLTLAVGLLSVQRVEMYLRASRLLDEARDARLV
jgi:hypothetical protein